MSRFYVNTLGAARRLDYCSKMRGGLKALAEALSIAEAVLCFRLIVDLLGREAPASTWRGQDMYSQHGLDVA